MVKRYLVVLLLLCVVIITFAQRQSRKPGRCPRKRIIEHNGPSGIIETPRYPQPYRPRQTCLWHIKVPRGYTVHFDFHDKFGIPCDTRDKVTLSTRRLYFDRNPSGSETTIEFCGTAQIPNVTALQRDMWIRFKAHKNFTRAIGFRATYTSRDLNECKERHRCQQNCINTIGSYRCSCDDGYALDKNGYNCTDIPKYTVKFRNTRKEILISKMTPKFSKIATIQAYVEDNALPIKYSFLRTYPKPSQIPRYPFRISPRTGVITSRKRLPVKVDSYQMTVKAEINSKSSAEFTIRFKVTNPPTDIDVIKFSKPQYSVIITDNFTPGKTVLHLSVSPPTTSQHVTYSISDKTLYFKIDQDSGHVKTRKSLSELNLHGNSSKRFEFTVVAKHREKQNVAATVVIKVIVVPAYSGKIYHEVFEPKRTDQPTGQEGRPSEFSFHRFFRQLSPTARAMSKAERRFTKMIQSLRDSIVEAFTVGLTPDNFTRQGKNSSSIKDARLRTSETIVTNLDTISLTTSDKLREIINASHCVVPTANCTDQEYHAKYRTFDGTCNNLGEPLWGAANMPFNRIIPATYWDEERLGDPVGFPGQQFAPSLPSPHLISQRYVVHRRYAEGNKNRFSHMMMQWGQFLDHDITFTAESEGSENCAVPRCNGQSSDYESPCYPIMYPGNVGECTMFTRSAAACQTDPKNIKPREQLNLITSYIDGSQIYGSSLEQANSLRHLEDERGYIKLDEEKHLLPELKDTLNPPLNLCLFSGGCFAAGDLRANEQIALVSMHTLWAREHNRLATFLKHLNPKWDGEKIFQETRKITIARLQHITYTEYLPKFLGKDALPPYSGYDKKVDATITNGFATSAFRVGHSMVRPGFSQVDENFDPIGPDISLMKAFFNNQFIHKEGIEPLILGLLANVSQTVDRSMVDGLTKHLFQQPGTEHGFDLAALNIQRGRDHGLPGYGKWRRECGLTEAPFFEETHYEIKDLKIRNVLAELYDNVEHSDIWVAGLAEEHVEGAMVGPTFHCILKRQFQWLRDGDRFWYENPGVFTVEQLAEIKKTTLAKVICDNLFGVISVQRDAFVAATNDSQRAGCLYDIPAMNMSLWQEGKSGSDILAESSGHWSEWIPTVRTSTGSWATYNRYRVCNNYTVLDIECKTNDDQEADSLDETFTCDKEIGFYCRNIEQAEGDSICSDYKFRVLCSNDKIVVENKLEVTGYPSTGVENYLEVDPKFRSRYPIITHLKTGVLKEATIYSPIRSQSGSEYLYLGRGPSGKNHRFLLGFDLRSIPRRSFILSAFLQLYLVSGGDEGEDLKHSLEVYPITSSDWHEENVTSVVPWNEDFLGLNSDVDKTTRGISSPIHSQDAKEWITINLFKAVYNWRVARRRQANYGLMVKLANETQAQSLMRFVSNAHQTVLLRPKLSVFINIPPW